jgi:hypothetical protein
MIEITNSLMPAETTTTVADAVTLAEKAASGALGLVIDSTEMYLTAGDELVRVNKALATLEEKRFSITRPMDAAKAAVMDLFRAPTKRLEDAKAGLSAALLEWKKKEDQRIAEERRVAEAAAKAEAERLARVAAEEEEKASQLRGKARVAAQERAQEAKDALALAEVAPLAPVVATATLRGVSTATRWKVGTVNLLELVKAAAADPQYLIYLEANSQQLGALATALKSHARVPGVTFEEVESTRVSRR